MIPKLETSFTEVSTIDELLKITYGNMTEVCRMIGINRGTLRAMMKDNSEHFVKITRNEHMEVTNTELFKKVGK